MLQRQKRGSKHDKEDKGHADPQLWLQSSPDKSSVALQGWLSRAAGHIKSRDKKKKKKRSLGTKAAGSKTKGDVLMYDSAFVLYSMFFMRKWRRVIWGNVPTTHPDGEMCEEICSKHKETKHKCFSNRVSIPKFCSVDLFNYLSVQFCDTLML